MQDHTTGNMVAQMRNQLLSQIFEVTEIPLHRIFSVRVFPDNYRPVGKFIMPNVSGMTEVQFCSPVRSKNVKSVVFPEYEALPAALRDVLDGSRLRRSRRATGEDSYNDMKDAVKAALLNFYAKMAATMLMDNKNVWSFIRQIRDARQDRVFCEMDNALWDAVLSAQAAGTLERVSGKLHHGPAGFKLLDSFKSFDAYGNIQLTFFQGVDKNEPSRRIVEVDIDPSRGLEHIFSAIAYLVAKLTPHPYDIHQILVYYQKIDPGYILSV